MKTIYTLMMCFATFWQMNAKYSTVSFSDNFSDTKESESLTISHHSAIDLSTKCSFKSDADYSVFNTNTSLATCNPPTSPQDSYVTSTTAKISWTPPAVSPANGYEIYYKQQ
ncbi:fibronectin type III domain-containing protein [Kaistella sp. G5-32]|uniref:Fibronectin type III domain-containing protein n=1 Tax=Kaistella gelatinilytica TaxID=2787636 RepID=A0ABS0F961_9FLAO|nr:fibronectin type III domain-containing protein [Kaistella gelatinilytica]MBF8456251.1 fibronectin type III domain-containing protein [Kaistella gelatinilytica]